MRKLIIITILLLVIVIILIGIMLFFGGLQPEGSTTGDMQPPTTQEPSDQEVPFIKEFDPTFLDAGTETSLPTKEEKTKEEIRLLVRNFTESYTSYSTNSGYEHIKGMFPYMTTTMQKYTQEWLDADPASLESSTMYSIDTRVSKVEFIKFSSAKAEMSVDTRRTETDVPEFYNNLYTQSAKVVVVRLDGEWKVDSLYWED